MRSDLAVNAIRPLLWLTAMPWLVCGTTIAVAEEGTAAAQIRIDPLLDALAWGSDHVGKSFPDYVTGDECLFCHRDIGKTWQANAHQTTVRPLGEASGRLKEIVRRMGQSQVVSSRLVTHVIGTPASGYLKRSRAYGRFDMLVLDADGIDADDDANDGAIGNPADLTPATWDAEAANAASWDTVTFHQRCAGCHCTAVEAETAAYSAVSLDCFVCHGDVNLQHTGKPQLAFLSTGNREARKVTSTCGQCHLRGGRSRTTNRPYPNAFVAGDNLFLDFRVDLSPAAIERLPVRQRHIYQNARDVHVSNQRPESCIDCHAVHQASTVKHQQLDASDTCLQCHQERDGGRLLTEWRRSGSKQISNTTCQH